MCFNKYYYLLKIYIYNYGFFTYFFLKKKIIYTFPQSIDKQLNE